MKYKAYITSHGGNIRKNNEDNAYLDGTYRLDDQQFIWNYQVEKSMILAAVFDGMGGIDRGEAASRIAAEEMQLMKNHKFSENISTYVREANKKILNEAVFCKMGTTYAAVSIEDDKYYFSNLGDSRGYLYRKGCLEQMTRDHNMVQELYRYGVLTKEQAMKHPDRHAIYQFLGMPEEDGVEMIPEPFVREGEEAVRGDFCLLCTDGLTDMVMDEQIQEILGGAGTLVEKAEELKNCALRNGGRDNITIVLIEAE